MQKIDKISLNERFPLTTLSDTETIVEKSGSPQILNKINSLTSTETLVDLNGVLLFTKAENESKASESTIYRIVENGTHLNPLETQGCPSSTSELKTTDVILVTSNSDLNDHFDDQRSIILVGEYDCGFLSMITTIQPLGNYRNNERKIHWKATQKNSQKTQIDALQPSEEEKPLTQSELVEVPRIQHTYMSRKKRRIQETDRSTVPNDALAIAPIISDDTSNIDLCKDNQDHTLPTKSLYKPEIQFGPVRNYFHYEAPRYFPHEFRVKSDDNSMYGVNFCKDRIKMEFTESSDEDASSNQSTEFTSNAFTDPQAKRKKNKDQTSLIQIVKDDIKIEPAEQALNKTHQTSFIEEDQIMTKTHQTSFIEEDQIKTEPTEKPDSTCPVSWHSLSKNHASQTSLIETFTYDAANMDHSKSTTNTRSCEALNINIGDQTSQAACPRTLRKPTSLAAKKKAPIRANRKLGHTTRNIPRTVRRSGEPTQNSRTFGSTMVLQRQSAQGNLPRKAFVEGKQTNATIKILDAKPLSEDNGDQQPLVTCHSDRVVTEGIIQNMDNPSEPKIKSLGEEKKAINLSSKTAGVSTQGKIKNSLKWKWLTKGEKKLIRAYIKDGFTKTKIARTIGRSYLAVKRYTSTLKISPPKKAPPKKAPPVEGNEDQSWLVVRLSEDGTPLKTYAKISVKKNLDTQVQIKMEPTEFTESTGWIQSERKHEDEDEDESLIKTEIKVEPMEFNESKVGIRSDAHALERLKWLHGYFMVKGNLRAIEVITQLEKVYRGEL